MFWFGRRIFFFVLVEVISISLKTLKICLKNEIKQFQSNGISVHLLQRMQSMLNVPANCYFPFYFSINFFLFVLG